jgi:hypothetical protein
MDGTVTGTDDLRLLAEQQLAAAANVLGRGERPEEALLRVYRASVGDFESPEQTLGSDLHLHPATDLWMLAHTLALGALCRADGRWSALAGGPAQLRLARAMLAAEREQPKQQLSAPRSS